MADDPKKPIPSRNGDDDSDLDPVDAELIAYLDGELEPDDAQRIEGRLAADPQLRARAEALRRSFALLDFLPKPEPSATFTTRTLDKIPAIKATSAGKPITVPVRSAATPAPNQPMPTPAQGATPAPVLQSTVVGGQSHSAVSGVPLPEPAHGRPWPLFLLLTVLALAGGYLGSGWVRSHDSPPAQGSKEPAADTIPLTEYRLIENLPLYSTVDDLDFLERLATAEYLGTEPSVSGGRSAASPSSDTEKPSSKQLEQLVAAFRQLSPERQEKVRLLDQQLYELESPKRERLIRVLEAYAAWLQRLPEADRKAILSASGSDKRLEAVRDTRNTQWVAGLPAAYRQKLKSLPAAERAALIAHWKSDEDQRRDLWRTARIHWESLRAGQHPWPFESEPMRKEVIEFLRTAYRPDDPKRPPRLTTSPQGGDLARLKEALEKAEKKDEWMWLGHVVYDFSHKPKYQMLPEPAFGKTVLDFSDLSPAARKFFDGHPKVKPKLETHVGKWPDFATAVSFSLSAPKAAFISTSFLGPCRPAEFKDEVKRFLHVLEKKATADEWQSLKQLEGKWPEYPRELVRLARAHDLSVPGAMPPGPPSLWEKTYGPNRPSAPKPGG